MALFEESAAAVVTTGQGEEAFRGSDDAGRQSRDGFRFAGYMTGNAACSRPLGRQRKRQAAPHGWALAEDSQAAEEDSRNTRVLKDSFR